MCLIIVTTGAKLHTTLLHTPGILQDIFESNPDGLGAMYTASKQRLRTPRLMPRNLSEVQKFVAAIPCDDRTVAVHFRQRTHGATDITMCHPYDVIPHRVAMMHNGILLHGNAPDKTKSDTWHYINGYLRPLLEAYPKAFTNIGVQNLIESDISTSNRFVIMDNEGAVVILNRETGIEHDGMWFSNTYAWSPNLLIPGYTKPVAYRYKDDDWWGDYAVGRSPAPISGGALTVPQSGGMAAVDLDEDDEADADLAATPSSTESANAAAYRAEVIRCVLDADVTYLTTLLDSVPRFTLGTLFGWAAYVPVEADLDGLDPVTLTIIDELEDEDIPSLVHRIETKEHAEAVAEALCWYGDWDSGEGGPEKEEEPVGRNPTVAELFAA